jgi:hypothetical protein
MNIQPLMQVCQLWTSILLSEPRLWTSIHIRSTIESMELAYSALLRSRDFPLNLTIEVPIHPDIQRILIEKGKSRIQHIRLIKPYYLILSRRTEVQFCKNSANLLKNLGPLPSLHSLSIDTHLTEDHNIWSSILVNLDAPQIRYVESAVFSQDILETSRYSRLQDLVTSSALEVILPELVDLTDLRRLTLLTPLKQSESTTLSESFFMACKYMAPLKSLGYFQEYSDLIWPLLERVSSSLCVLELEITCGQLPNFFTVIQDMQYLHDLSLDISVSFLKIEFGGIPWEPPVLPPVLPRIRVFALDIIYEDLRGVLSEYLPLVEAAHLVLEALEDMLPHVHTLHLKCSIYSNDLVRLVEKMDGLMSLNLTSIVRSDRPRKATCPTLSTLTAYNQDVLCYLSMPNLVTVKLIRAAIREEEIENEPIDCSFARGVHSAIIHGQHASTVLANGGEFTQLLTLEWYNCRHGYNYRDNSFPSLTNIIFSDHDAPQSGTAFCESVLRYPRSCPRLKTICFRKYPEWDMLLYMLLRRNVLHGPNKISRISNIELQGFPAPFILAQLCTLLLGKIPVEMPSPEELSFVDIQDIYFDQTMYVNFIS